MVVLIALFCFFGVVLWGHFFVLLLEPLLRKLSMVSSLLFYVIGSFLVSMPL
jgi:hypothetical protein